LEIADSEATVHTTPHEIGMINIKKATAEDAITIGNRASMKAGKVASTTGMISTEMMSD
jgi:hypothetical protein